MIAKFIQMQISTKTIHNNCRLLETHITNNVTNLFYFIKPIKKLKKYVIS
jgi:hypothetical protein